ncbi:MAG: exodeoxyribonuclease III, partial [Blautia obeum]
CGDLNVAHEEIDLKNPKTNRKNAGFTDEERACFTKVLESGFIDTFRYFYPDKEGIYSWWSYRFKAREKNAGWRIDYFITSPSLKEKLQGAAIHTEIMGSDHCPIELDIDLSKYKSYKETENGKTEQNTRIQGRSLNPGVVENRRNKFCSGDPLWHIRVTGVISQGRCAAGGGNSFYRRTPDRQNVRNTDIWIKTR